MKNLIIASSTALALAMAPSMVSAQDEMDEDAEMAAEAEMSMSAEQTTMYEGWPADRRTAYDNWPGELQTYYWTLDANQQTGWWVLNDDQRGKLYAMAPEQRTAAWTSISSQMSGQTAQATRAAAPARANAGAKMTFVGKEMVQTTPASAARTGEYPICEGDVQDGCIQPRAAGKNYGNRPLDYWPGKPASEMD